MFKKIHLLFALLTLSMTVQAGQTLKVTVFDARIPNKILSAKEFPAGNFKNSHFLNLMSNQSMPFVEVSDDKSRCSRKVTPLGLELIFRSSKISEFRYDVSVTAMTKSTENYRIVPGIEGCERLSVFDVQTNAWTDSIGIIQGYPQYFLIGDDYKVVLNIYD